MFLPSSLPGRPGHLATLAARCSPSLAALATLATCLRASLAALATLAARCSASLAAKFCPFCSASMSSEALRLIAFATTLGPL